MTLLTSCGVAYNVIQYAASCYWCSEERLNTTMIEIPSTIDQGVATLIAAGLALAGVIIGLIVSQVIEFLRISREAKIRQKEKIVDRMIAAHEAVIEAADIMMTTALLDNVENLPEDADNPVRGVGIVTSVQLYESWMLQFKRVHSQQMWLSPKVLKEVYFTQDYSVNLYGLMKSMTDAELETLSVVVMKDFIKQSGILREESVAFITKKAVNLELDVNPKRWHKYKKEVTIKRLQDTNLFKTYLNDSDNQSDVKA
jgi:hypothetical protein